ncbi:MAG TPA: hypothetical protein VFE53_14870 [Mucilaginibacter sp.]|jgi:hypothetical protein|nr:hypothetical protein [Mucilaginibacter sp.]
MKTRYILTLFAGLFTGGTVLAQQGIPVTDQQPVVIEGLSCGYKIKSLETKTVSDKGDFSRYAISFWVRNVSPQPRILPFRIGPNGGGAPSDNLVQFNCLNATGYRLTSKYAVIKAPPYNYFQNGSWVKNGFAIMPGQTVSVDEVMIVPLNEPLNMMAFYIGYTQQLVPLVAGTTAPVQGPQLAPVSNQPPPVFNADSFYQIKNANNNTFINVQTGVINCSTIQNGWFSAQWQIVSVPGSNYVKIKNRWKGNFIDTERGYITMAPVDQSPGTIFFLEPVDGSMFHIKNIESGQYLSLGPNNIHLTPGTANPGATWIIQ